jgi:hypothetical protein
VPPHSNSLPPGERKIFYFSLSLGRNGGQASSEDLLPLGYGEWDRIKVRVKREVPNPNF